MIHTNTEDKIEVNEMLDDLQLGIRSVTFMLGQIPGMSDEGSLEEECMKKLVFDELTKLMEQTEEVKAFIGKEAELEEELESIAQAPEEETETIIIK